MRDWGTIAYDDEHKRWQWWSRYVTESDARVSFDRRMNDGASSLLVRLTEPKPTYHRCQPDCACIREVVHWYEPDTRIG